MPKKSLILNRGWTFRGREGISLLVHAYHHTLVYSLFFLSPYFVTLPFATLFFLVLARVMLFFLMLLWCDCCNVVILLLWLLLWWWSYCARWRLLISYLLWLVFLPFHPLTTFVWVWVSFQTSHWFVHPLTTFVWVWVSFQTSHWFVNCHHWSVQNYKCTVS